MSIQAAGSQLVRGLAVAMSLFCLFFSNHFLSQKNWRAGFILLGAGLLLYIWAEEVIKRPRFLWVPGSWLGMQMLLGESLKGEGFLLGLPLFLVVSAFVRRSYQK
ncbi:hypothetical protein COW36_12680 [bacterium (Candidatus Blackallbacteria) CG17_big_fil_post_rev_8_21_14_2_50_48_46]|uniref:Uncharacterized protein n=1 Tax=bacterium (Candidatus Blackallbacteria) CG17_big_fil_post_rev_8_21_14_2_50_48_46 TaxID=2014261 RepID=A0A2M7G409_9BACT|nr:MAG: hypothetical protein COW64_02580 [bacterium (Candidatus Blackallbacteria) CG18_big_fil_WC_8_21_14_2_50_49_26]PIW16616.1 MAG: hypothetical protein COW36_12680 [bacterium (Candidatus Blackallbacteria) CG17_big_fil_post_rev_8_21_14_2_50_48_46]PIW46124.1 MAG: hypothetical protein COW20_17945 [bacterium (Candidatus Blackallbacteria) CG13_big_fil_rev_8_21_14_2_50_49_14]